MLFCVLIATCEDVCSEWGPLKPRRTGWGAHSCPASVGAGRLAANVSWAPRLALPGLLLTLYCVCAQAAAHCLFAGTGFAQLRGHCDSPCRSQELCEGKVQPCPSAAFTGAVRKWPFILVVEFLSQVTNELQVGQLEGNNVIKKITTQRRFWCRRALGWVSWWLCNVIKTIIPRIFWPCRLQSPGMASPCFPGLKGSSTAASIWRKMVWWFE